MVIADTGEQTAALVKQFSYHSAKGRAIEVYIFGAGEEKPTLVIGGIHGDERSGISLARSLLNDLLSRSIKDIKGQIILIPIANPDGYSARTRSNANGIDINRNFPTKDFRKGYFKRNCNPGKKAASEPETKAILEVVTEFSPAVILTFHADMGCVNYDGPAKELAEMISKENGLPVKPDLGYPTPGSMGTYYGRERNLPIITLELLPEDNQWERHGKVILAAIGVISSIDNGQLTVDN